MMNRNILIESESHDTISNAKTIVDFLRDFHHEQQFTDKQTSVNSHIATAMMLDCVGEALSWEHSKVELLAREIEDQANHKTMDEQLGEQKTIQ